MATPQSLWQFWIDRGGTFTDIIAKAPADSPWGGRLITRKLLSENPGQYDDAAVAGMWRILAETEGLAAGTPFPAARVEAIKMGTTVATNALLTRTGARLALVITAGFADALRIATQHRPRIFDLDIRLPEMLYEAVVEIPERMAADGTVVAPLDEAATRTRLEAVFATGLRAVAIVLMHGYRHTDHESRVAAIARAIGFTQVSVSHAVSPLMKLIGRGDTTVADAYLSPVLRHYIAQVESATAGARLLFMQSNGGLVSAAQFQGRDAVLSGPAGGVIGAAGIARAAGFDRIIGFDMGGTSTDVCHVAGDDYERSFETVVAGVRLRAPMMEVHSIAAGGGSILSFDGLRFRVGPQSAGADPGPTCYGKGGPLCVTDANLLLGRIQPEYFPKVFGPAGNAPLDLSAVRGKFAALAATTGTTGQKRTPEMLAEDFLALAVDNMARAIRKISIERGHDVTSHALICFGGAAGQHACAVADALGMETVFIHPLAGVLSAYGVGVAALRTIKDRTVEIAFETGNLATIDGILAELEGAARGSLAAQFRSGESIIVERRLHLRYAGTDTALAVAYSDLATMEQQFATQHRSQFGFGMTRPIVCEMAVVEAATTAETPQPAGSAAGEGKPATTVAMVADGRSHPAPLFRSADLAAGQSITGPAIVAEELATTVIMPGWRADVLDDGALVLRRMDARTPVSRAGAEDRHAEPDAMRIELFNNRFMSIAEQMGAVLQNTAQSVNIKERLDFSCAVFDAAGSLLANAPHMPVHLGSMGESVRAVMAQHRGHWRDGDVFVLNNPYAGGTHLPDITVITPVFLENLGVPSFFVAARGHHADIGGITPGSMPPISRTLDEEGVLLDNLVLVRDGQFQEQALGAVLRAGRYPARAPETNLADLRAQVAANAKGAAELRRMVEDYGSDTVNAYAGYVLDHAEEAIRRVLGTLRSGRFTAPMDNGGVIKVAVTIDTAGRSAIVDFTGTSPQLPDNFNAPSAVCRAAVLYVLRTLIADDIPLNDGVLRPITLVIPPRSMLNPTFPAAVVAGNVETSQILCDALLGALGVLAASQGTMNNFTFGNATHQYYETVAGGAGAGAAFDGASAVQTHMTNSRLTDPEVLEWRFPVRVERFAIRRGSGGDGLHKGGDGIERRIRFAVPMTAALLSGRRLTRPFGLAGGAPGLPGEAVVERADGRCEPLGATAATEVNPGDAITISTPGGGGYGRR